MKLDKTIKKKLLLDLILFIIFVPFVILGWFSSPLVETPIFNIDPAASGVFGALSAYIGIYLFFSWIFYDFFYKK